MKVLIVNLAGVKVESDGSVKHFVKAGSRWPMTIGFSKSVDYYPFPFWLAYTTALLKRDTEAEVKGLDGVVLDMTPSELFAEIKREKPMLLVTELTALTLVDDILFLKNANQDINCRIAVCGSYVSVEAESILRENLFIEFAARGEYEVIIKELVETLMKAGNNFSAINGLTYRDKNGEVKVNAQRELLTDLDFLPYPDREDFPATIYPDFTLYSPCINILSSRGCPGGCVYCTDRHVIYNSPRYRMRNPLKVVDEIEYCIERYKARQFYFDDQSLVVNKNHITGICNELLGRNIEIPWTCMGDAMFVDYDTLKIMASAGCIGMKFGVESASQEILNNIHKPLKLDRARQVVSWCRELGISTHATFCLGLPGETVETIKQSMEFMESLNADTAQVSKAIPYPGTPMYKWAIENNYLITTDLSKFDGMGKAVLSYPNLSNVEIDQWYEIFSRKVARKKILKYLKKPAQSISIIVEMWRRKGLLSIMRSIKTFVRRAV